MKFVIFKRKGILKGLLVILLALLLTTNVNSTPAAAVYFGESPKLYPIYNVKTDEKKVAITFDSAWGADKTSDIMNICDEFGIKATFFLVGFWVEDYPDKAKEIAERGFEIGSHSNTHPDLTKLSREEMRNELTTVNNTIASTTGKKVGLFRAPYGAYNNTLIEEVNALGMRAIQWNIDSLDWKGYGPDTVIKRVTDKLEPGSIILCHNNADHVLENTRIILQTLQNKGYTFVLVSELVKDVSQVKIGVGII